MFQVPSPSSGNLYSPLSSVMTEKRVSPRVAMTEAPGTGTSPNLTIPWCSDAANVTTESRIATPPRKKPLMYILTPDFCILFLPSRSVLGRELLQGIDDQQLNWCLTGFQPQPELFRQHRRKHGRHVSQSH